MVNQLDPDDAIENTFVFDVEMSARGANINKLAEALNSAANRETFKADVEGYLDQFELTNKERQLILDQDWLNLVKAGGNIYHVIRIAAQFGTGLYPLGAQQLGLTYEEFLATRNVEGAT